jgi:CheY-like chemotaxis protein
VVKVRGPLEARRLLACLPRFEPDVPHQAGRLFRGFEDDLDGQPVHDGAMGEAGVVMIVEDDDAIRDAMADVLSDTGFDVHAVADGHEALTMLATVRPDLILLDWGMPRMSGEQFLAALKADALLSTIPVVVVTASHRREVTALGVEFIQKPISLEKLIEVAREHCKPTT